MSAPAVADLLAKKLIEKLPPSPAAIVCSAAVEEEIVAHCRDGMKYTQGDLFDGPQSFMSVRILSLPELDRSEILAFDKLDDAQAFVQSIETVRKLGCDHKTIRHVMRPWLQKAARRSAS